MFVADSIACASSFCALNTARLTFSIGEPIAPVGASFTFSDSMRAWISLSIALTMAWVSGFIRRATLLQIHGHDDVQKVLPAAKQAGAVGGGQLKGDLVGVDHAQCLDQERRIEADLDVAALELAGEVHFRFARFRRTTRQLQALLAEVHAHALG